MASYNHKDIEEKWQKKWEEEGVNTTKENGSKKFYILDMFPYPSGEGLHVGHPKGYIATDIYSRFKKMSGFDILHPMGFDAFGLPAEQFALKNKVNPNVSTAKNVTRYKEQLKMLGLNYDWEKEINTTDPKFYKWTQWMWKQMYKKGLVYESYDPINWCPSCMTGLANEDLENGLCERCGSVVEKKPLRQWTIRITDYADRLLADIDKLDWEPHIKELQRNWIGKSEGSEITFKLVDFKQQESLTVFTTRADTLFGATFMAISYELAEKWIASGWSADESITRVITEIKDEAKKLDFSFKEVLEKKGVDTGIKAINPATGKEIPVFIANYILSGYGTGAIMAVPAHDERDHEFAKQHNLPIQEVIMPSFGERNKDAVSRDRVAAIIEKDGTFLCEKLSEDGSGTKFSGKYIFVGGGIENNESPEEALTREMSEELGVKDFTIQQKIGTYRMSWFSKTKNEYRTMAHHIYHINLDTSLIIEDKKEAELVWVDEKELLGDFLMDNDKPDQALALNQFITKNTSFCSLGELINSGSFSGLSSEVAAIKITESVGGKLTSQYKLKEWSFARQRYWGEPFPIVFDENHKSYVVADTELPVVLPQVEQYEPTGTGESPLANITEWVDVYGYINDQGEFEILPKDDTRAKLFKRETNTMPQWAGSSWYYLRFIDPHNDTVFADKEKEHKWSPVDFYVGGAEHATRHLIYARFWHKFLFDCGFVSYGEPFLKLQTVGLIMAEDGRKMSKRWGNIVNPDDVVAEYGADTLRLYEMFMGPFDQAVAWSTKSMMGVKRFLDRFARIEEKRKDGYIDSKEIDTLLHQTIHKVGGDIEAFKFNTAISALMVLLNAVEKEEYISPALYEDFLKLVAPFAPHLSEELWRTFLAHNESIHLSAWPTYNEEKLVTDSVTMAIQIAGKLRGTIDVIRDLDDKNVIEMVKTLDSYRKYIGDNTPKKIIVVKNKIVNIVI